jgi:hypothetical protein
VGASNSGMAMQPLANFHHPSGRKFPLSVSNHACSCEVYHGSYSDKVNGNEAVVTEAEVCPSVRAAYLASLSVFQLP